MWFLKYGHFIQLIYYYNVTGTNVGQRQAFELVYMQTMEGTWERQRMSANHNSW